MTAVILAGGKSRRLGQDKAWLKIGGQAIIRRTLACLSPLFEEVIIVGPAYAGEFQELGVKIIPDELPETGPLGGLYSGLKASSCEWVFCCACDMPFLNSKLIAALKSQANHYNAIICKWAGKTHPLHSFYTKSCLPVIQNNLENNQLKMMDILPLLTVKYVDEKFIAQYDADGSSLFNLNTPKNLKQVIGKLNGPQ